MRPRYCGRIGLAGALWALSTLLGCSSETPTNEHRGDAGSEAFTPPETGPDTTVPEASPDVAPSADAQPEAEVPDAPPPPPPPTDIDPDRLATTLQTLSADAMGGRLTGTASGDDAEEAIRAFLEGTGIDVRTQDVTFPLYEVGSPIELSVLDDEGQVVESLSYIDDFREVDFSGSGLVEAELAFVGYGLSRDEHDSYEGFDAEGKVVAMLTGVPSGLGLSATKDGRLDDKIHVAWEHGAKGVIFIPFGTELLYDQRDPEAMELRALDRLGGFRPQLHHADLPVVFIHGSAAKGLFGSSPHELSWDLHSFDVGKRVRVEVRGTVHPQADCRNVFGVIEGQDETLSHEVVILGAHYDHLGVGADGRIFNGAADNASGTAVVMETAATLATSGAVPRRTVVFALWCAEEQGLWGSKEYGQFGDPLFPLSDTKLMIQVDYLDNEDGPYLTNVDDDPMITAFLGDAADHPEYPVMNEDLGGGCASDDCVFLDKGVPAYRFLSYGPNHHRAEDDFEALRLPLIERVAEVCLRGMGAVAYE